MSNLLNFLLKYLRKCLCLLGGRRGEGFFTDTKIALISPNPFVPDEKEGALSIEKARPAQGLASENPGPLPFPLPFPKTIMRLISATVTSHSEKKGEKGGRAQELPTNAVRMFSDIGTKRTHPIPGRICMRSRMFRCYFGSENRENIATIATQK